MVGQQHEDSTEDQAHIYHLNLEIEALTNALKEIQALPGSRGDEGRMIAFNILKQFRVNK